MILIPEVGDTVTFHSLAWINPRGVPAMDKRRVLSFKATVTKAWEDEETGWRYWAKLKKGVDVVDTFSGKATLKKGTTVYVGQYDMKKE